ncbi:alpha/beta hydrolase [Chryseolinea lacunae]|uniref:Alpha/beta hydrolase n=1 Tax=Chryseolinea lacunae TaxID=2801331 RepID=A0ABS1KU34_9BACT|nr:alpha/beta hydrolase [Chryseolinea lacunae]MBL0742752.1 alpha/beta hydrolase [Chryseolinea lacunae]
MMTLAGSVHAQQNVIRLYNGAAPGSEGWTWEEQMNNKNSVNVMCVFNVVNPTLTVFTPEPAVANSAAVVVCPGGGFHFLAIDHEGNNAANWLVKKGFTVFVLRYRVFHITSNNPFDDMLNTKDHEAWDREADPIIPLAIADGRAAIAYVRSHAADYKLSPQRIGIMGFSAGGMVAASTAFHYTAANRPDFVAPIYADMPESRLSAVLPDAPPLFVVCAADDDFGFATHALNISSKWLAAKRPVELHLLEKGGHGFGIGQPGNTTSNWLQRFEAWMPMHYSPSSK